MICYKDKCWCEAKTCKKYRYCDDAFPYAKKEQQKQEHCQRLPYAVRDMSDVCGEYEVRE